ncbi:NAD(P)/FAD-dependent oxidoreductase [Crossiella sp. CA198]|uniref:NAD(P)/FAD-dependent oxidoreductase n=1 Tax=Crossiella sp. CA198 TaxID=3455607 RepID=UPI003F8D3BB9
MLLVVGGGVAAANSAVAARQFGYPGPITVLSREKLAPYDRTPLSKQVLLDGDLTAPTLPVDWTGLDITLRLDQTATALHDGVVETERGRFPYRHLVIATGATPIRLPGAGMPYLLRTHADACRLRGLMAQAGDLVIVGAGWIGAEAATAARALGCRVTVLDAGAAPLDELAGVEVGAVFARWYTENGIDLRLGQRVAAVEPDAVITSTGEVFPATAVLVGVGARPAVDWLAGSAVRVDGGVLVDPHLRTNLDGVYAAGDVASYHSRRYARLLRCEHFDDAQNSAVVAGQNLNGKDSVYDPVPYGWSEQFGHRVQFLGHHDPGDELRWRGAPTDSRWSACWLHEDRLRAILAVNAPQDILHARKIMQQNLPLDPARLANPGIPLKRAVT